MTRSSEPEARVHDIGDEAPAHDVRTTGIALAAVTAVISGFSVFVNGYGVGHFDDSTTYTTAKNLVAAVVITAAFVGQRRHLAQQPAQQTARQPARHLAAVPAAPIHPAIGERRRVASLIAIAVIGGSIPFVLFFEGLARVSSSDAAFIHKTMVAWVAVLGVVILRERIAAPHLAAVALILIGYAAMAGGIGLPEAGDGELLILAATLCWSVEVVIARSLLRCGVPALTVSTWRMGGGIVLLIAWAFVRGAIGDLVGLSAAQWWWVLLTGLFLSAYVLTWHHALARAQAVDVTAVLATGAVLTAVLDTGIRGTAIEPVGVALLLIGGLIIAVTDLVAPRRPAQP
jgi:drug/metabolite transporter (DMT)-like permease